MLPLRNDPYSHATDGAPLCGAATTATIARKVSCRINGRHRGIATATHFQRSNQGEIFHKFSSWSFGVLLWEIATLGSAPYPGVPTEKLYDLLTKDGYRMIKPRTCSRNFYNLMLKCWALDPDEQPKFHELISLIETEEHDGEDVEKQQNLGSSESNNSRKRQDDSGLPDTPILPTRTFP
ncbi:fibroblast growth factor receptor 3-like [Oscarella lobularis]|uniref:fibroblast growth factor receptor 3-like n=1 Tax=Oscarella lobularis TaxID=121494 RepID=UPI003314283F